MYNQTMSYQDPPVKVLFRLLVNWFLLFCSDLAVLIFPMLLVDFQRPNWKSAQGPREEEIQLLNPNSPLVFYSNKILIATKSIVLLI